MIDLALGGGSDALLIVGQATADTIDLGANGVSLDAGGTADVTGLGSLESLAVAAGGGDDVVSGKQDSALGGDLQLGATIAGADGNDTLTGGAGKDVIGGGDGNDSLKGAKADDTLEGGGGTDVVSAGGGRDSLSGGAKADRLKGGGDRDNLDAAVDISGQRDEGGNARDGD